MNEYKVVSLFSGGGGLDLGFINQGFNIVWAIELNENAYKTYKNNLGNHIINEDINNIDITSIPDSDVIIGGPPCQSFSLAGNRNPNDPRGKLIWKFLNIIEYKKPKIFVFENVTGILSAKDKKGGKVIDSLTKQFKSMGYNLYTEVLNSVNYGVPQRRRRVIIVGVLGGGIFEFPTITHGKGLKNFVSVSDALGDLPSPTSEAVASYLTKPKNSYQTYIRGKNDLITDHVFPQMSELDKYIAKHVKPGGNYMDIPPEVNSKRIRRLQKEGGRTTYYGKMHPENPSYTINTYFNRPNVGCNLHYKENRLITIREAMRLQSFPDSYVLHSSTKKDKHMIVGNAVPPLLAENIAKSVKIFLKGNE